MSDIKSFLTKMKDKSPAGGGGDNGEASLPQKAAPKKGSIEKTYQKKSQLEHILLRPDTYIGSVDKVQDTMWIYDAETKALVQKQIEYVPGLYKIFDEILVNAADNKQRDKNMDCIKVDIDCEENTISVWNNGKGIPVVMHKEENMYVPTMIFGHLLTSSNYNDEEEKVTGGRNGYGAKLCNIFSTKFTVETGCKEYKRQYKQTWASNMTKNSDPKIRDFSGTEFTKVTFSPDLVKFKMDKLDADIVGLMSRRAYDVAASTRGVKVFLNGTRVPVKCFKDYIDLFVKGTTDPMGNAVKVVHETINERWEIAVTLSEVFQQMSFVNSIATTKGGRHVDYVTEMVVKQLLEVVKKKNKGGIVIRPNQVKQHLWIFVNCLIVNPTFDSQTKEHMTLQSKNFGSKIVLPEKFINMVGKCGIIESVLSWAKHKAQTELAKTSGKKQSKLKGIPKLEDANEAGGRNALQCTLILTEGDSAKSLAVSGLGVIGRDHYGVFPLKGKLLNVREATHKQILENQEINNLIKILGLQYKKKYLTPADMKTLRYGKVMIMTDQDQDGSHIKGLLINFIHYNWPDLLKLNFLEEFITPIVKARKRNEVFSFFSLPEFEEWKQNTPNNATYRIKYYKGLGTSNSDEAREYFSNMARHRIQFRYKGQEDDDHIVLAFSKKQIEQRKVWLTNFMVESKRRKELSLAENYLYTKNTKYVSYSEFVNLELILFSNADNIRSIPSAVDGLKPGQRKVMFTCIKRNDKREVKVAQLAGSVAEMSAYHHGEVSLAMTIVNLAQNFVGSNNINLLEPRGQFGSRLSGGKDAASARYIFTKMSPITRLILHPYDDPLLKYEYDDAQKIEPVWYMPILPMVLVNGADGIGTGWMTKIPNHDPRKIVANLRDLMDDKEPPPLMPWYKNFKGTIEEFGEQRFVVSGEISIIGPNKVEITELPVGTWSTNYKENVMEPLLHGSDKIKAVLSDYKEYNTDRTVRIVATLLPGEMEAIDKSGGLHKTFRLQTTLTLGSMCAFDELGCMQRYDTVDEIVKHFYKLRLNMYHKRKEYLEGMLEAEASQLSDKARFILEKCNNTLVVENKKRKTIVAELIKRGYRPDPIKNWKATHEVGDEPEPEHEEEEEDNEEVSGAISKNKPVPDPEKEFENLHDVKQYDYLLGMTMWMLTDEKKNELLKQKDTKLHELEVLKLRSALDLWREDLDTFMDKLDDLEKKERITEAGGVKQEAKGAKGAKAKGKKKINLEETMPSPVGKRVLPIINDDLKKRIQISVKSKESRGKPRVKKEGNSTAEDDEFDEMTKMKPLGERVRMSAEGKGKAKKPKDGLKQTKLNFPKKSPEAKANGSPKKKSKRSLSNSEDEAKSSGSDVEFAVGKTAVVKERILNRRAATKVIKYSLSDEEDKVSSADEDMLFDNEAVKENDHQEMLIPSSDDDLPPQTHETSDDMFDTLIGKKKSIPDSNEKRLHSQEEGFDSRDSTEEVHAPPKRKMFASSSQSDDDKPQQISKKRTAPPKKKKKEETNEDVQKVAKPKRKPRSSFFGDEDSSDEDFTLPVPKTSSKKTKAKINSDSDSPVKSVRGRTAKQTKYVFSDDESD